MRKEMFEHILLSDEHIVWAKGVNKRAYITKTLVKSFFLCAVLSMFFGVFIGAPVSAATDRETAGEFFSVIFTVAGIIFALIFTSSVINTVLSAQNTFFAITDKRVIKRSGAFNNTFSHYSLKNIGNIIVTGDVFDSKGPDGSANLTIVANDFHTNTDGNRVQKSMTVHALDNGYKAYSVLTEMTEGNNEVLRVETI